LVEGQCALRCEGRGQTLGGTLSARHQRVDILCGFRTL
jgi:hypothetical protein